MMIRKQANTSIPVNRLIANRWSGRAYDSERPVKEADIRCLLEAARWAPSCYGDQPWRYIVCDRSGDEASWNRALSCLVDGNQAWAKKAPLLLLVFADTEFSKNGSANRWGSYDTGAASMSICLQATDLGLMTHQMGGIHPDKIIQEFSVPQRYQAMSVMAVGYQLAEKALPGELREKELAPRERSPLQELCFTGTWGQAYPAP